jgi:hypothetical protein
MGYLDGGRFRLARLPLQSGPRRVNRVGAVRGFAICANRLRRAAFTAGGVAKRKDRSVASWHFPSNQGIKAKQSFECRNLVG